MIPHYGDVARVVFAALGLLAGRDEIHAVRALHHDAIGQRNLTAGDAIPANVRRSFLVHDRHLQPLVRVAGLEVEAVVAAVMQHVLINAMDEDQFPARRLPFVDALRDGTGSGELQ